jgi:hypothetical protein
VAVADLLDGVGGEDASGVHRNIVDGIPRQFWHGE